MNPMLLLYSLKLRIVKQMNKLIAIVRIDLLLNLRTPLKPKPFEHVSSLDPIPMSTPAAT